MIKFFIKMIKTTLFTLFLALSVINSNSMNLGKYFFERSL